MARTMSATERAYHETKNKILDGTLAGGDVITEGNVSADLGISRTPVREAFLRLQSEGLLQLYPKRGAVVSVVAADEALHVAEAREVVESFAIEKLLSEHGEAPPDLVDTLWDIIGEMAGHLRNHDLDGYGCADTRFHLAIVDACGNPFLAQYLTGLRERQRRIHAVSTMQIPERAEASYQENIRLLELLERGELDQALAALRGHLRAYKQPAARWRTPALR